VERCLATPYAKASDFAKDFGELSRAASSDKSEDKCEAERGSHPRLVRCSSPVRHSYKGDGVTSEGDG
jgi:hypothetical protein